MNDRRSGYRSAGLRRRAVRRNRATDEEQRYFDMFDPATRLPRPALLRDRLGMALSRAERERRLVGVMFVHVDVPA
jgi:GGDEF domain-containing protein